MIYSAALLRTCVGAGKFLLGRTFKSSTTNEDIDTLTRSRQELQIQPTTHISSIYQKTVDRIVEHIKRCSEGFPTNSDRMFWMQSHHCDWMLIYWLCDSFEAFSELFAVIGIRSPDFHPVTRNCLIETSLLRKDAGLPEKFLSFLGLKPDWALNNIDILLVAIRNDDNVLFKIVLEKIKIKDITDWEKAWTLAYTHLKWDIMDLLLQKIEVEPHSFFCDVLFWLVNHHKWDEMQILSDFIQPYKEDTHGIFRHNLHDRLLESLLQSCTELIYKGSLHATEKFFNILRCIGFSFREFSTQLAILPALASRNFSTLKLLSGIGVISPNEAIDNRLYERFEEDQDRARHFHQTPFPLTGLLLPLDVAIAFVSDLEVVEYLCRNGARLQKDNDVDVKGSETLRKLRITTSVVDARKQNCYIKGIIYQSCVVAHRQRRRYNDRYGVSDSIIEIGTTTGRIIFEGDCRHLYNITDVSTGLTWQSVEDDLCRGEWKDAPIPMATSWPAPLSTQESWDNWRLKVINILERTGKGL